MKKAYLTILVFVVATFALASCSKQADTFDSHGKPISMASYKGKWVVINYWATWCKPCIKELPDLNALYTGQKDKVMVLGVNYDKMENQQINQFANKLAVTFPMLREFPIQKYGINDISGLPTTYIVNPEGKLAKTLHGPQTQASLEAAMGIQS